MSSSKDNSKPTFTPRELEHLVMALSCTKTALEIDYKAFAEKAGLKNGPSAKASWHGLKKKLEKMRAVGSGGDGDADGGNGESKTGGKRKAVEGDEGDDDEEAKEPSPEKKKPAAKKTRKAAEVKAEVESDADATEEVPEASPVKKTAPAKKTGKAPAKGKGKAAAANVEDSADGEDIVVASAKGSVVQGKSAESVESAETGAAKKTAKAPVKKVVGTGKGKAAAPAVQGEGGGEEIAVAKPTAKVAVKTKAAGE
ncbi:hypothetical protein LTR53_015204 [Teratosphaeriaceae sp. CCFEE 6253]|nr:hypothetical protein LTR53_015204 [Teratosphaeriaceae sp. CCFEE 6253]